MRNVTSGAKISYFQWKTLMITDLFFNQNYDAATLTSKVATCFQKNFKISYFYHIYHPFHSIFSDRCDRWTPVPHPMLRKEQFSLKETTICESRSSYVMDDNTCVHTCASLIINVHIFWNKSSKIDDIKIYLRSKFLCFVMSHINRSHNIGWGPGAQEKNNIP